MKYPKCPDCNGLMDGIYIDMGEEVGQGSISTFGNVYEDETFTRKVRCFYCKPCHAIVVRDLEEE